jgi:hypothetical protein
MIKYFKQFALMAILLSSFIKADAGFRQQPSQSKGRYEDRADSIRREHMTPRKSDSIEKAQGDKMPVVKSDTQKENKMPIVQPEKNQHMPVKELSDTSKNKK